MRSQPLSACHVLLVIGFWLRWTFVYLCKCRGMLNVVRSCNVFIVKLSSAQGSVNA